MKRSFNATSDDSGLRRPGGEREKQSTVDIVSSAQMIDWDLAISTGTRFARQGPQVSLADARAVVAELRGLTAVVQQPVREVTGLTSREVTGPVAVVDRPGWIKANVGGFRVSPNSAAAYPRPVRWSRRSDRGLLACRRA
jgi:uncharacterized protein (DUF2342 family)